MRSSDRGSTPQVDSFRAGDPVNWDSDGRTVYGFVTEDCPYRIPPAFRVRVVGLDNSVWLVDIDKLRHTQ